MAPTRHQVTCGSKPGVGGIFSALALFCYMSLGFSSKSVLSLYIATQYYMKTPYFVGSFTIGRHVQQCKQQGNQCHVQEDVPPLQLT